MLETTHQYGRRRHKKNTYDFPHESPDFDT